MADVNLLQEHGPISTSEKREDVKKEEKLPHWNKFVTAWSLGQYGQIHAE